MIINVHYPPLDPKVCESETARREMIGHKFSASFCWSVTIICPHFLHFSWISFVVLEWQIFAELLELQRAIHNELQLVQWRDSVSDFSELLSFLVSIVLALGLGKKRAEQNHLHRTGANEGSLLNDFTNICFSVTDSMTFMVHLGTSGPVWVIYWTFLNFFRCICLHYH